MSKSYLPLLLLFFSIFLVISACKRDGSSADLAFIEVDFLMNELDIDRYFLDFTPEEFERNQNDPSKVLTVKIGEPVKFKDTSVGEYQDKNRKWQLNDEEWVEIQENKVYLPEFITKFEEPGLYNVSLYIGEIAYATKLVNVVSGNYIPADDVAAVDDQPNEIDVEEPTQTQDDEQEDLFSSRPNNNQATPPPSNNTNTAPPEPVRISNVSFTAPREVTVGQSFSIKDISSPSSAIRIRTWDLGDGNTKRTKGATLNQMYFSSGEFTITLCLNNSDQCTSRRIMVKPRPARKEVANNTPAKPKPNPPVLKKPEVANVEFNIPSSAIAGESVPLTDVSSPADAVAKRRWAFGDGTGDLNTGKSAVSHVFTKPGTYTIKLCVNDSDKCLEKEITINPKPEPKPVATNTPPADEFLCLDIGEVGLSVSQRCNEMESAWKEGASFISLEPQQRMELEKATIFSERYGFVDIVLTTGDKKQTGIMKNVALNNGPSDVYLSELGELEPGVKYTLMIKPSAQSPGHKITNSANCSPTPRTSKVVKIDYGKDMVLFNIQFCY